MVVPIIGLAMSLAGEFLPDIIRSIAGDKTGDIAEKVVNVAQGLTGETEPESVMKALRANPDMVLKFQMELVEERREALKYEYLDRKSARDMAMKSQLHTWAAVVVSVMITGGFGFVLWGIMSQPIPEGSKEVAYILLGTLATGFIQVVNFWLGSSRGSQEKSQMLVDAARK